MSLVADFNRSIPPLLPEFSQYLSQTLAEISRDAIEDVREGRSDVRASEPGGTDADKYAAAAWMQPRMGSVDVQRTVLTNGTQSGILLLLDHLVGAGGLLLTEGLTYTPLSRLAERACVQIKGLALDSDGVVPSALEDACRMDQPKALYLNPTLHNPTTATMPTPRRLQVAEIARRYGVAIIEDDPLGLLHPNTPPPIAALAPDVCWYVMGVTKCLAHGLRTAFITAPDPRQAQMLLKANAGLSYWHAAPLSAALLRRWVETGIAAILRDAIADELRQRWDAAFGILAPFGIRSPPNAMHLWLPLPNRIGRSAFVSALAQDHVFVRPADVFQVGDYPAPNAVRLSLGNTESLAAVVAGAHRIAARLGDTIPGGSEMPVAGLPAGS